MATYPTLPATLAAMRDTRFDPQGTESASLLDDALRQTRTWLYDFLAIYIDESTGKIKSSAFGVGLSLPAGSVRGTNPTDQSQREISQGSILTADLADSAVTGPKLAAGAVTGDKVQDNSISGSKLLDGSITSSKIAAGIFATSNIADFAITNQKVAVGTLTGDRLSDGTIPNTKMGGRSIQGPQMPVATQGQILVGGNGTGGDELAVKTLGGSLTIDKDGLAKIVSGIAGGIVTYARVAERTVTGTDGGTMGTNAWSKRGGNNAATWALIDFTRDFIEVQPINIKFKEGGTYLIRVHTPCVPNAGGTHHRCRLVFYSNPSANSFAVYYGTSVDGLASIQNESFLETVVVVDSAQANLPSNRPYFYVEHFVNTASAKFGTPTSATPLAPDNVTPFELYAEVSILRIQETI